MTTPTASLIIKVDSSGAAKASDDLDRLSESSGRAERSTTKLAREAKVAGALIGGLAAGAFALAIRNTIEQERVTAQLEARLRSTGGAAGLTKDELLDMASGLQAVTTFGDEAVIEAQNLLLTFTKIGRDVFPQALETVLDMSVAMGQDLKSSAIQLGKALNDPIQGVSALSRVGVQFTEAQKETIEKLVETNQVAAAQRIVLAELETQMGGSARAARDTLGGAIEGLKNAFGDLLEGDSGSDGVRGATAAINDLTALMSSASTKQAFADIVSGVASVTAKMLEGINVAIQYQRELFKASSFGGGDFTGGLREGWSALMSGDFSGAAAGGRRARGGAARFLFGGQFDNVQASSSTQAAFNPRTQGLPENWGLNVNPNGDKPRPGGGGGGGRTRAAAMSEEEKAAQALQRAYEAYNEQLARGIALHGETTELAKLNFEIQQGGLKGISEEQANVLREAAQWRDWQEEVTNLESLWADAAKEREEQVRRGIAATDDLIESMEFELSLIGMSNVERAKAIALRYAEAGATDEQRRRIEELAEAQVQASKEAQAWDGVQRNIADTLFEFASGAESATQALKNFVESLANQITRNIANNWAESITGWLKGAGGGGGGGGNWFASLFGALLGGGRAGGGPVMAGQAYVVGEGNRPEIFVPTQSGRVMPVADQPSGRGSAAAPAQPSTSVVQNNKFVLAAPTSSRTQSQIAARTGFELRLAQRLSA